MKIFLDTNLFTRYLTKDNTKQAHICGLLIQKINLGHLKPYTSNIVISELIYVMIKLYKADKQELLIDVQQLLALRNLTIIEKTNTQKALELYNTLNIKYGDCLIATQIPPNTKLCTYDEEFGKIKGLEVVKPEEIVSTSI